MLILSAAEVRQALPMSSAIDAMRQALQAIARGAGSFPLRTHLDIAPHAGTTLVMPAYVKQADQEALAVKVVSVFGDNPASHQQPRIQGVVIVLSPATGAPVAVLEGTSLTAIRTAAASAVATDTLAIADARRLAILGAGVQARSHIEAMLAVRPIEHVRCWSRTRESADQCVRESAARFPAVQFTTVASPDEAVAQADIVCTVTSATSPLFDPQSVQPGTHLNLVGSSHPAAREVPGETVEVARVYVDDLDGALAEAGDLLIPIAEGRIPPTHLLGMLGDVLDERVLGRTGLDQITLFKSVGHAVEDAIASQKVVEAARRMGLGRELSQVET